jgi:IS5 family transposase
MRRCQDRPGLRFADRPMTVHLDRGYDSGSTRRHLAGRGLTATNPIKGHTAPIAAGQRWVVERANAWTNAQR